MKLDKNYYAIYRDGKIIVDSFDKSLWIFHSLKDANKRKGLKTDVVIPITINRKNKPKHPTTKESE